LLGGYRTYAQQAYLYKLFLAGAGAPAEPAGASEHNLGIALDVATTQMRWVVDQIGWRYGWAKVTAPSEWWHVTYVG
jgi:LAS superfamily LD-carboxypeptidase LdcB